MPGDFGGSNDGQCEYSFFSRCPRWAVVTVQFGQQGGWRYRYCHEHADSTLESHEDAFVVDNPREAH